MGTGISRAEERDPECGRGRKLRAALQIAVTFDFVSKERVDPSTHCWIASWRSRASRAAGLLWRNQPAVSRRQPARRARHRAGQNCGWLGRPIGRGLFAHWRNRSGGTRGLPLPEGGGPGEGALRSITHARAARLVDLEKLAAQKTPI